MPGQKKRRDDVDHDVADKGEVTKDTIHVWGGELRTHLSTALVELPEHS